MTTLTTTPMSQLTFVWPESTSPAPVPSAPPAKVIPLGIAVPAKEMRRGRPEHISDLLLVVLDRYGISPEEFLAGLQ